MEYRITPPVPCMLLLLSFIIHLFLQVSAGVSKLQPLAYWPSGNSMSITRMCLSYSVHLKGHLLCKIHFFMSLLHQHVSPLCKVILRVSGKKILSLFVLIHLYKNLSEEKLIRFWPLYDVITIFLACVTISQSATKVTPPPTLSPESPPRAPLCSF